MELSILLLLLKMIIHQLSASNQNNIFAENSVSVIEASFRNSSKNKIDFSESNSNETEEFGCLNSCVYTLNGTVDR